MNQDDINTIDFSSIDELIDTLAIFCGAIMLSLSTASTIKRDLIIRNFIARGMVCTQSILTLWRNNDAQGAWILHRTLMDRLFHLRSLIENDSFIEFEEYSFIKTYEARRNLLSDPDVSCKINSEFRKIHSCECQVKTHPL